MVDKDLLASRFNISKRGAGYSDLLCKLILGLPETLAQLPNAYSQISVDVCGIHMFFLRANDKFVNFTNRRDCITNSPVACVIDSVAALCHIEDGRGALGTAL